MRVPTRLVSVAVLAAALAVSGCKSPEEKAEEFYLSGVEYVKAEDPARAMIQFRNALLHVPDHLDAALAQARLLETQGDLAGAQAAYAAVSETRPDDLALRHRLVGMSLRRGDWEEVERFAQAILARAPESAEGQVARVALDYRAAKQDRAPEAADDAAMRALALRESRPDDTVLLRVALDWYSDQDDLRPALAILDDVLSRNASDREMQLHRVALLARLGEGDIAGDRLRRMVTLFPDDRRIRGLLVAWLVSVERTDEAESFLRGLAGAPGAARQGHLDVIAFLELHRGVDVALIEIERLIEATDAGPDRRYWSAIQASRAFAAGEQQAATDAMRGILEAEEETTLRFNLQVMLARMLNDIGETDEAESLVDEVLAADPLHADALQMRAMRYLGDGAPQEAVADLRAALAQRPRSPDILMLMARAHMAEGNRDLAGERLATAVQMSAQAPRPSLTYAAFLREGGRGEVAERVLRAAMERTPRSGALTAALAELMVERGRFGEAAVLIDRMAETDTPNDASRLHAMRLAAQGREAEGMSFLSSVIRDGGDGLRPVAAVVQTLVRAGRADEAITYLDTALTAQPDDASLLLLRASVLALVGDVDGATLGLRGLLAGSPGDARAVGLLIPLLRSQGGETEAEEVLAAALVASPESRALRLMEASRLEARGEIGSAVGMLKELHSEDSADLVAANNLASLLTRTMPGPVAPEAEAIEAARSAARVLRGLPSPAFQDTYGWVEFLRGNLGEALSYLEPAAQAMPGDPRVQYHLGRVYEALGRDEAAASQFARVAELDASASLPETESALGRLDAQ